MFFFKLAGDKEDRDAKLKKMAEELRKLKDKLGKQERLEDEVYTLLRIRPYPPPGGKELRRRISYLVGFSRVFTAHHCLAPRILLSVLWRFSAVGIDAVTHFV